MSKIIYKGTDYGAPVSPFTGTDGTDSGTSGLVPAPSTLDGNKFLKANGTWSELPDSGGVLDILCADLTIAWAGIDHLEDKVIKTICNSDYNTTPVFSVSLDDMIQAHNNGKILRLQTAYRDSEDNLVPDAEPFFYNTLVSVNESEIRLKFQRSMVEPHSEEGVDFIVHRTDTISILKYEWNEYPEVYTDSIAVAHMYDVNNN